MCPLKGRDKLWYMVFGKWRWNMMIDPVCKMNVEPNKVAAKENFAGQVYYFCSETCHKAFVAAPEKYTSGTAPADHSCCGGHK